MNKSRFTGVLAASMASVLAAMSFAACFGGSDSGSGSGEANTDTSQTKFSIIGGQSALSPGYDNNEVLKKLQEETGISIAWNTMSDSLSEQVNIRISGGDLPDAFMGVGFSNYDIMTYGDDGTFIDLTPYITEEYMPNLTAILKDHPDIRAAITMDDGKIYGLPAGEQMGTAGIGKKEDYSIFSIPQFSMINKKWLDELGLEVPKTLDELKAALKAFKDNDMSAKVYGNDKGSTIPMSTGFDQWCWGQNIFYAGFGFTNWPNDVCNDLVLQKDGKVNFVCDDDNYRQALTYFHDWYDTGLIYKEIFSQDDTKLMSKCQQGYVGVSTWWYIEELMGDYAKDYEQTDLLAVPVWKWGVYYEEMLRRLLDKSGQAEYAESSGALNYFWGMPQGVVDIEYAPALPLASRRYADFFRESFFSGATPFLTPFHTQSGETVGAGQKCLTAEQIVNMDYLADNVVGSIPSYHQLSFIGKETVDVVGVGTSQKDGDRA